MERHKGPKTDERCSKRPLPAWTAGRDYPCHRKVAFDPGFRDLLRRMNFLQ